MARMKDYIIWAAEKLEKDYPGYSFDVYMKLITESNAKRRKRLDKALMQLRTLA